MKKVGIVTLPLHFNFGGVLQAFALQYSIKQLGYEVVVIKQVDKTIKQKIKSLLYLQSSMYGFVKENFTFLELQEPFSMKEISQNKLNTLIVGSDQVWRPDMGNNRIDNINRYFLKTDIDKCVQKVAYAASFGVDFWSFTTDETKMVKTLIDEFSNISVREISGVALCSKYMNINNVPHVLDPTMLVDIDIYKTILTESPFRKSNKHCFVYLLDYKSNKNKDIVSTILPFQSEVIYSKVERNIIKKFFRSDNTVERWLASIYYSDMIITDSFHGCVFSILFHKEFYVIENTDGGNARIHSLLSLFGLKDRLISQTNIPTKNTPIDWQLVDEIILKKRAESIEYIKEAIAK